MGTANGYLSSVNAKLNDSYFPFDEELCQQFVNEGKFLIPSTSKVPKSFYDRKPNIEIELDTFDRIHLWQAIVPNISTTKPC